MPIERIIIRDLEQRDYAFLMEELAGQGITPLSHESTPGKFDEPATVTVILAVGAPLAIGLAGWLMSQRDTDIVTLDYEEEDPGGRRVKKHFTHKVTSNSATDPELINALKWWFVSPDPTMPEDDVVKPYVSPDHTMPEDDDK